MFAAAAVDTTRYIGAHLGGGRGASVNMTIRWVRSVVSRWTPLIGGRAPPAGELVFQTDLDWASRAVPLILPPPTDPQFYLAQSTWVDLLVHAVTSTTLSCLQQRRVHAVKSRPVRRQSVDNAPNSTGLRFGLKWIWKSLFSPEWTYPVAKQTKIINYLTQL